MLRCGPRISNALHSERLNREIDEELQLHIEEAIASDATPTSKPHLRFDPAPARGEPKHSRCREWLESLLGRV